MRWFYIGGMTELCCPFKGELCDGDECVAWVPSPYDEDKGTCSFLISHAPMPPPMTVLEAPPVEVDISKLATEEVRAENEKLRRVLGRLYRMVSSLERGIDEVVNKHIDIDFALAEAGALVGEDDE